MDAAISRELVASLIMRICDIPGCGRKHKARGFCLLHYERWQQHGNPLITLRGRKRPTYVRFWPKLNKGDGCWEWTGGCNDWGYGMMKGDGGKMLYAHRVSYELHHGEIPNGLFVCHVCDNPKCANPDHLFLGTHKDNMADMMVKGRARNQHTRITA
jgi:hypothetical protein